MLDMLLLAYLASQRFCYLYREKPVSQVNFPFY